MIYCCCFSRFEFDRYCRERKLGKHDAKLIQRADQLHGVRITEEDEVHWREDGRDFEAISHAVSVSRQKTRVADG